jgi:hypothetical protein
MFATRNARGTHAASSLCSQVGTDNFAYISVSAGDFFETTQSLSMSWWLSMSVQQYLDAQITRPGENNAAALQKIVRAR